MMVFITGLLFSVSIFLLLEAHLIRKVFGLIVLGSSVNLALLICGRLNTMMPAFIHGSVNQVANPLTQALVLTAIVIGFGLLIVLAVLLKKRLALKEDNV